MIRVRLHNPGLWWTAAHRIPGGVEVQWPPSPWTVLSSLVAGAHATPDPDPARQAIQLLAAASDPDMWLPAVHRHPVQGVFVGKTGPHDAETQWELLDGSRAVAGLTDQRTKHKWLTARAEWTHTCAFLDFSVDLDDEQVSALAEAALATSYVGRATDCVMVGVLTPHAAGWVDHTCVDGRADPELTEPAAPHELWQSTNRSGPVRAATPDILQVLDLCHERRHRYGLPRLPDHVKGRLVTYVRREPADSTPSTRVVLLLKKGRSHQEVMSALPGEPLLLGGENPWAVSFDSRDDATTAERSAPKLFRDGQPHPRHIDRYYGRPACSWTSVVPLVAHPNRRIAEHEITTGLQNLDAHGNVGALRPCGPCPELPHLTLWRARLRLNQPYPGPLRLGHGQQYGYGRFHTDENKEG
ncbi:hypothetical protein [Nocardia sp. CNY236]|uniref:hypothetical protein n=1 Tax=Nocardia sp. CNY236 TaxID=1169152 RepID=UPI0003F6D313|nr:hypothetical protein [Nocardia sp. CNY236]